MKDGGKEAARSPQSATWTAMRYGAWYTRDSSGCLTPTPIYSVNFRLKQNGISTPYIVYEKVAFIAEGCVVRGAYPY
jgi:hypothetical protein